MDWGRDERVGGVLEKLRTYNDTLPSTGLSKVQNEIIKVNEMLNIAVGCGSDRQIH